MSFPLVSIAQGTELTSGKLNVCGNVTESDKNSVAKASQVISASFTAVFYLVMFFQGILVICIERFVRISSSHGTLFVFFVGGLFACINVITTKDNLYVVLNFRLFTVPLIGIIFLFFGVTLFSRELPPGENRPTLGRQQPSMGLVVSIITVPLVGIEIVLLIATFNSISTDKINEHLTPVEWLLLKTEKSLFLAQKIFQALFYLCLRKTRIRQDSEEKARFYFRLLSFFNFIEWIDSLVNVERDVDLSGIKKELDGWFNFVTVLYQALIIDYSIIDSPLLFELHWLPVEQRITFKILLFVFKSLNGLAPFYLSDLISTYVPSRGLRSASLSLLHVPRSNQKTCGDRAFAVAAPRLWNALPIQMRQPGTTLDTFKRSLKTLLFRQAFYRFL